MRQRLVYVGENHLGVHPYDHGVTILKNGNSRWNFIIAYVF